MSDAKLYDTPSIRTISEVISELRNVLIRKNKDYDDSAFQPPLLNPTATAESGILTRMSDKISRIRNLLQNTASVDEALEDTVLDLAGYAVIFLANRRLQKNS